MNKKIIFSWCILLIIIIGLVSSLLHLFKNEYLLQYFGLSHNLAGGIHSLVSFVILFPVCYFLFRSRKQKK